MSGSTDSAINFSGSADLHTPIHPPQGKRCIEVWSFVLVQASRILWKKGFMKIRLVHVDFFFTKKLIILCIFYILRTFDFRMITL